MAAPTLTVAEVKAQLKRLHGRSVRVRGQMNECWSLTCKLCTEGPADAAGRVCLGLSFATDPKPQPEDAFDEASGRFHRRLEGGLPFLGHDGGDLGRRLLRARLRPGRK